MKTILIVGGVIILIVIMVFLYLLIAGADESRKNDPFFKDVAEKELNEFNVANK